MDTKTSIKEKRTSDCCEAPAIDDIIDDARIGRCSKCKEMAVFLTDNEYQQEYEELSSQDSASGKNR